ncbi:haloacid dehalogenase-like hydrolase domain-containing protein Sgpp [Physcomitrium patens]|uniref:Uncharacterized protein n=1 Tax=Physcomitrium patens TaxID=3218 RepID=A0A2K1J024_PHYPA|nr:haloacid dehalogenase-like hydrolase domain-containing protein Sgpp [Physcomitrium patens]XP_024401808.1 haloacid dehalogenase-like hydrolase domain-containing protein Sgpp [Physcomitrium patens]XP_024401809.1 haloacid dehalogenase-like hydrolase domain-containing protein Sgpp [Physcomitrium patens]XP_024401810.1 haloacid dehalogenase-like hydrolase domain-containing protein Sgpp [Physcomitrium patens]XP_024401811.1 haloacid dehalogenase-like hydrolase domain-containing protein Sgpp [Physcom|eukprot:XP_024401807.1 haloacid dehalogenase-like hydrolase domain-containing protein Sgpp [Physcomitrella patens]
MSSSDHPVTGLGPANRPLPPIKSVKAILFDVDGTLADSDPLHYIAFRDMLVELEYNNGIPISEEFFSAFISGKHNSEIGVLLFPDWDQQRRDRWLDDKEAYFRRLAAKELRAVAGLKRLADWIVEKGFRRAAVTNAPRPNAEQMIAAVGLTDFFEHLVIGSECERAKPFPDPYLKALEHFGVSAENAFAFEDSPAGLSAAVAAGLPVVGITTGNPGPALLAAGAAFLIEGYNDPALWSKLEK